MQLVSIWESSIPLCKDYALVSTKIIPDNCKITSAVPANRAKLDKYDILNYRPVSILIFFSKIYEKLIRNHLVFYFDNYFSPFISAYGKG